MTRNEWIDERVNAIATRFDISFGCRRAIHAGLLEAEERAKAEQQAHGLKALLLAHEAQQTAVAAERERCARIVEEFSRVRSPDHADTPKLIAAAIRARE